MQQARDQILVERAVNGDRLAFSELIETHYSFIFRVAFRWTGNRSDAEDVTQNVCIKLARSLSGFKGNSGFTSWLYSITLNTVRDMQRKQQTYDRIGQQLAFVSPDHTAPEDLSESITETLWKNVHSLPEKQRDAVLLVYAEGLNHRDAAEILGCAEKTVSWHIHKARETLRTMMTGNDGE